MWIRGVLPADAGDLEIPARVRKGDARAMGLISQGCNWEKLTSGGAHRQSKPMEEPGLGWRCRAGDGWVVFFDV